MKSFVADHHVHVFGDLLDSPPARVSDRRWISKATGDSSNRSSRPICRVRFAAMPLRYELRRGVAQRREDAAR